MSVKRGIVVMFTNGLAEGKAWRRERFGGREGMVEGKGGWKLRLGARNLWWNGTFGARKDLREGKVWRKEMLGGKRGLVEGKVWLQVEVA